MHSEVNIEEAELSGIAIDLTRDMYVLNAARKGIQIVINLVLLASCTNNAYNAPFLSYLSWYTVSLIAGMLIMFYRYKHIVRVQSGISPSETMGLQMMTGAMNILDLLTLYLHMTSFRLLSTNKQANKYLYAVCFIWIYSGLVVYILIAAVGLLAIFCLPVVILYMQISKYRESKKIRKTIDELPVVNYTEDSPYVSEENACCGICLNRYEEHDELKVLKCRHVFHKTCVDDWLEINPTCPFCVRSILEDYTEQDGIAPTPDGRSRRQEIETI